VRSCVCGHALAAQVGGAGTTRSLFLMSNNTLDATEFFWIPPNRVVELGGQVEI
jgi:K+ transporter